MGSEQPACTPDTDKDTPPLIEMLEDGEETEPMLSVKLSKTSCGDNHNIGLDSEGKAYCLPSPLDFNPFPNGSHKVTDIACGKEHCLLLTEHGQGKQK